MKKRNLFISVITALTLCACGENEVTSNVTKASINDTSASASSTTTKAATPKKMHSTYPSITALIDSTSEYATDNGTFKLISEKPLHIQISPLIMSDTPGDQVKYDAKDGLIYIAYMAFATTSIKDITVTSVPILYDGPNNKNLGFVESARFTATIHKDKAQQVMQQIAGITNFDDLLGLDAGNGQYMADAPSRAFEKLKSHESIEEVLKLLTKK